MTLDEKVVRDAPSNGNEYVCKVSLHLRVWMLRLKVVPDMSSSGNARYFFVEFYQGMKSGLGPEIHTDVGNTICPVYFQCGHI